MRVVSSNCNSASTRPAGRSIITFGLICDHGEARADRPGRLYVTGKRVPLREAPTARHADPGQARFRTNGSDAGATRRLDAGSPRSHAARGLDAGEAPEGSAPGEGRGGRAKTEAGQRRPRPRHGGDRQTTHRRVAGELSKLVSVSLQHGSRRQIMRPPERLHAAGRIRSALLRQGHHTRDGHGLSREPLSADGNSEW